MDVRARSAFPQYQTYQRSCAGPKPCVSSGATEEWANARSHHRCYTLPILSTVSSLTATHLSENTPVVRSTGVRHAHRVKCGVCARQLARSPRLLNVGMGSCMWVGGRQGPKPTLKRAEEMDMDDLPEALPRRILENYSWLQSDDDMHVHILIPIDEPVTRNCVRAQFRYVRIAILVVKHNPIRHS